MSGLHDDIKNGFLGLAKKYDLQITQTVEDPHFDKFVFSNQTTGIVVYYESRDQFIEIMLYKLIDGEIVGNTPQALKTKEEINGFNLNFIVHLTAPEDIPPHLYEYRYSGEDRYIQYAELSAQNLQKHTDDILSGDFSRFPELEKQFRAYWEEQNKR